MSAGCLAILNARSGGSDGATAALAARIAELPGTRVSVADESTDVSAVAKAAIASGTRCILVAGGDGTISAVANAVAGTPATLGLLPAGTFNHFARDLGVPTDLDEALRVIAIGHAVPVDAGEVNGRLFINNAGLGLYPGMIALRERRRRRGAAKWPALAAATLKVLADYRRLTIRLEVDGRAMVRTTPAVFVGNNEYTMEGVRIGTRERLDRGRLSLSIPTHAGPWRLVRDTLRAMLGGKDSIEQLDHLVATEVRIDAGPRRLTVSVDGELVRMNTPLHFRIRPGALRVLVPPGD